MVKTRRFFAVLLTCMMLLQMVPSSAFAQEQTADWNLRLAGVTPKYTVTFVRADGTVVTPVTTVESGDAVVAPFAVSYMDAVRLTSVNGHLLIYELVGPEEMMVREERLEGVALYARSDTASEVLLLLPAKTVVVRLGTEEGFVKVSVAGVEGYIESAALRPNDTLISESTDEVERVVRIYANVNGTVELGDVIRLRSELVGFDLEKVRCQWQKSADDVNWIDEVGANEPYFTFIMTPEYDNLFWRLTVEDTE